MKYLAPIAFVLCSLSMFLLLPVVVLEQGQNGTVPDAAKGYATLAALPGLIGMFLLVLVPLVSNTRGGNGE